MADPKPRVLITARAFLNAGPEATVPLTEAGVEVIRAPKMGPLTEAELLPLVGDVDAAIASSDAWTERVLDAASPRLRGIMRWGVGYDSIHLAAATARGVVVGTTPGANTEAVADFTLGVMLAISRRLCECRASMSAGEWQFIRGVELWRKTLGIIGFGAIGRAVCRRARGFDMRVLAYDPWLAPETFGDCGAESRSIPEIVREADFVTLHAAATQGAPPLLGEAEIRAMKPGAFLINAGRGSLVDEAALLHALDEDRLAGAALDAFVTEPLPADHPFRHHPRVFATPHNAFNTAETGERTNAIVIELVLDLLQGRRPRFVINPEVFERTVEGGG